jgi:rhamnogalacturonyl hydrolase YesR
MRKAADWQLAHPSTYAPYDWTQAAFYTGVMALADVSGDAKYLAAMRAMGDANQWRPGLRPGHADDYAGRKVFWSRGNGWVIAGLARVLQDMPPDYPDRPRYVTLFMEMAEKVASLQGADGCWRSSLLDPASLPNPETSGTGFLIYSLAWGINKGLLDRARYEPNVRRGWTALVKALQPDGMLGWVQRIGDRPGATSQETTEVYGVGALLLAGSEVYWLAGGR